MNPFFAIYCRIFQKIFHIALPILPYRKPKLLHSNDETIALLHKKHIKSVLIVTDQAIRGLKITAPLEDALAEADIKAAIYDGTHPNPTSEDVEAAASLYRANECKAIIGFGGGSAMDCAKACGVRIAKPNTPLKKLGGILKVWRPLPLLIAVPTTAGTGSETTLAAVIVDSETRHKYCINSFPLIPKYALLDPNCTRLLPAKLTATTGLDALTHAVEAYIGRSTTKETRYYATEAVSLIFKYLPVSVKDGNDLEARKQMLHAAYYAGNAFTRSYVGYVHAIAHSLGGKYDIPHGLANSILLPVLLEEYGSKIYVKLHELATVAGLAKSEDDDKAAATAFIDAIKDMKKDFGIGEKFPEIQEEDIRELAKTASKEANPLYPVPVLMGAWQLEKIYRMVKDNGC